jgi:hypothetical protein
VERWVKIMVPTARLELTRVKLLFDKMAMHLQNNPVSHPLISR